jgi:hypothetical protein
MLYPSDASHRSWGSRRVCSAGIRSAYLTPMPIASLPIFFCENQGVVGVDLGLSQCLGC